MIYLNTWFNSITKLDLIYKINIVNSYAFPSVNNITINICSKFAACNQINTLCSITVILLITNQKPILYSLKNKKEHKKNQISKKNGEIKEYRVKKINLCLVKHKIISLLTNLGLEALKSVLF